MTTKQLTSSKFIKQHFPEFISYLVECGVKKMPRGIDFMTWWSLFCAEKFANS